MEGALDRVSKKQKVSYSKCEDVIDKFVHEIQQAAARLGEGEVDVKVILRELHDKLINEIGVLTQLQKEVNAALSKYGKVIEKQFCPDLSKAYREMEFDSHLLNRIIALHFYRQGLFELGDCFVNEAEETFATSMKLPFYEMYQILESMKANNVEPALEWARSHHKELQEKGSFLEFKLHQLQFVHLLVKGGRSAALQYARSRFLGFAAEHMSEIKRLMGCLIWAGRLDSSPYSDLFSASHWERVAEEFTRECCSLLGQPFQSPLQVTISAGSQALPTLVKLANVMAAKKSEWQAMKQLPVEIEIDKEFQFHSVFACPVSRDQSTAENPPMLLPCGHVLCKQSIHKLAKNNTRPFKCPYCPQETTSSQCRHIYF